MNNEENYVALNNTEVNAINRVTQLEDDVEKEEEKLEKLKQTDELRKTILNNANVNTDKTLTLDEAIPLKTDAVFALSELQNTAGDNLDSNFVEAYMDAIDKFDTSHDIKKLSKIAKYNQKLAADYINEIEQLNNIREKGNSLLLELSSVYPQYFANGRENLEAIKKKLNLTNDMYEAMNILGLLEQAQTAASQKDLKSLGEINENLSKPIVHNETNIMYSEKPDYSPVKSPFKALNNPALKNIEICTFDESDLDKPVNISKIKNNIIMDNFNLGDLLKYWKHTDSKFKFVAGLMWKVIKALGDKGINLVKDSTIFIAKEGSRIILQNIVNSKVGISLGIAAASKIPVPFTGGESLLSFTTRHAVDTTVNTGKTVIKEFGKGIKESKTGKEIADAVVSNWQKGKKFVQEKFINRNHPKSPKVTGKDIEDSMPQPEDGTYIGGFNDYINNNQS